MAHSIGHTEHLQVDDRVLVPGEAQVADLPLLDRLEPGLEGAVGGEDPVGVIVIRL